MQEPDARSRLQPGMGRTGWRIGIWSSGFQSALSAFLAITQIGAGLDRGRDIVSLCVYLLWFVISIVWVIRLVRLRRNDAPFWAEEEERLAEWDRRGRRL